MSPLSPSRIQQLANGPFSDVKTALAKLVLHYKSQLSKPGKCCAQAQDKIKSLEWRLQEAEAILADRATRNCVTEKDVVITGESDEEDDGFNDLYDADTSSNFNGLS